MLHRSAHKILIVVRAYFVYANHLVLKVQNHSQALFLPENLEKVQQTAL